MYDLTQKYLQSRISYDSETGVVIWFPVEEINQQAKTWNKTHAWKPIINRDKDGYLQTSLRIGEIRKYYRLHRLIWLYVYGDFPDGPVDHVNRDKSDNRLSNLRIADASLNCHNIVLNSRNTNGVKGAYWHKKRKKWQVYIGLGGKPTYLGLFSDLKDAEKAYATASIKYAKEFSIYSETRV